MSKLIVGGKARPGLQAKILREAGFSIYEAVIIDKEDWKGLEQEAKQGLFPSSVDIKGKEQEQRWRELNERTTFLNDLSLANSLGFLYVAVDGFPDNITKLTRLNYEFKAIEALPATSPAALDAKTAFPKDLVNHARSAGTKVLVDICHLFQTAVYLEAMKLPLEVIANSNGTYSTQIPSTASDWYFKAVEEIANSGYLAPFAHVNGHIFVAEQTSPKEGEKDNRIYLPDGRLIRAVGDTALTVEEWRGDLEAYNRNSYAVPITLDGQIKVAQWFKSHTFITDGEDEIFGTLNVNRCLQQLTAAGIKALVLENNKESVNQLKREADFFNG